MSDALYDAILGVQPSKSAPPPTQKSAPSTGADIDIPDSVLDSLRRVESGKDRFALNKDSKAMGPYQYIPETVQMLHKQGYKFNPYDEAEARDMTRTYLKTLVKQTGSLEKALGAYGGHITKDPAPYVNKVMSGAQQPITTQASNQATTQSVSSEDPLYNAILGIKAKQEPVSQQDVEKATTVKAGFPEEDLSKPATFNRKLARQGEKMREQGSKLEPFVQEVAKPLEGITAEDYAKSSTPAVYAKLKYGTDKEKQEAINTIYSGSQKVVKGITDFANAPNKGEIIKNALSDIVENPGKFIGESAKSVIYHPEQIPLGTAAGKVATEVAGKAVGGVKEIAKTVAESPVGERLATKAKSAAETMQEGFQAYKQAQAPKTAPIATVAAEPTIQPTLAGVGAARSELNPFPKFTGEEVVRGEAPQIKFSKMAGDVVPDEQMLRAQIISEINPQGRPRTGLITGNENTIRNEYTLANSPERSTAAEILKQEIANEQRALPEYARKIVDETGADPLLRSDYERGQRLNDTFASKEGATGFFKNAENSIYEAARDKVGDKPVTTTNVDKLFTSQQFKAGAGLKGTEGVLSSAESLIKLAKEVGFEDEFGRVYPASSVGAMDAVKKALNRGWTPDNASMIRKINQSIDKDIASVGGADLLKKADAIHEAQKIIFGSKGIKSLFGEVDPNGVQKATDFAEIPKKLNSLPDDQWKHIYETADKLARNEYVVKGYKIDIPEELQLAAKNAKAEMQGNLAREIYQSGAKNAGEWSSDSVNKTINARMQKIKYAFDPEQIRKIYTLNAGGYLMPAKNPYEGAGLQAKRVAGLSEKLPKLGQAAGAMTGIPLAESTGAYLGKKSEGFFKGRTERKQAQALEEELQRNKQLGTKLKDIGKE